MVLGAAQTASATFVNARNGDISTWKTSLPLEIFERNKIQASEGVIDWENQCPKTVEIKLWPVVGSPEGMAC